MSQCRPIWTKSVWAVFIILMVIWCETVNYKILLGLSAYYLTQRSTALQDPISTVRTELFVHNTIKSDRCRIQFDPRCFFNKKYDLTWPACCQDRVQRPEINCDSSQLTQIVQKLEKNSRSRYNQIPLRHDPTHGIWDRALTLSSQRLLDAVIRQVGIKMSEWLLHGRHFVRHILEFVIGFVSNF